MTGLPRLKRTRPPLFGRRHWYRRRVELLEAQAVIDDVTGLRNQRALWRELSRQTPLCSKESPLTLVMLDFDLFATVNESHGHAVGDALLARGAALLREAATSPRLAFRYGGEEFVLLVAGHEEEGRELAERVRSQIAQEDFGSLPAVTISCGVAELDSPVEPWVALDRVDAALRQAKRTGRNCVAVAGEARGTASAYLVEHTEHETARRAALALAVATLEVRHRNTAEHSGDVLTLCEAVGVRLGFDDRALECLRAGAQLHDVGKVAVPSVVLNKAGPLDDDEWALIRKHTIIGERILRSVPEMAEIATIVRHSHEHWDGSGYPDGLAGERIPLPSRVILCADAFHACRSDRPYRAGRSAGEALDEVRACAGTQFDPAVVDALVCVAEDVRGGGGVSLPRNKRLVVLLAALALTGAAAIAAVPALRDAVGSVFGTTTPDSGGGVPGEPGRGFTLGPLGEILSVVPGLVPAPVAGEVPRDAVRVPSSGKRARRAHPGPDGRSPDGRSPDGRRAVRNARARRPDVTRSRPSRAAPAPAPLPDRTSTAAAPERAAAPGASGRSVGRYCRGRSRKRAAGQPRSDFATCVRTRARNRGR